MYMPKPRVFASHPRCYFAGMMMTLTPALKKMSIRTYPCFPSSLSFLDFSCPTLDCNLPLKHSSATNINQPLAMSCPQRRCGYHRTISYIQKHHRTCSAICLSHERTAPATAPATNVTSITPASPLFGTTFLIFEISRSDGHMYNIGAGGFPIEICHLLATRWLPPNPLHVHSREFPISVS